MNTKQFVILEHLCLPDRGFRFFSTNCHWSGSTTNFNNNTHGHTGELWYKEVGFADTVEEAQSQLSPNQEQIPTFREMMEYHKQQIEKRNNGNQ